MPDEPQETKLYIGAKLIRGTPMDEQTFLYLHKKIKPPDHPTVPPRAGYLVIYPDGYKSWSPKKTFEDAYREVTPGEKVLFNQLTRIEYGSIDRKSKHRSRTA